MSLALAVGALILAIGVAVGLPIGRTTADPTGEQARRTYLDERHRRRDLERQLAAARREAERRARDPATPPPERAWLHDFLIPRLTERRGR